MEKEEECTPKSDKPLWQETGLMFQETKMI
jgi:hypothetical protein